MKRTPYLGTLCAALLMAMLSPVLVAPPVAARTGDGYVPLQTRTLSAPPIDWGTPEPPWAAEVIPAMNYQGGAGGGLPSDDDGDSDDSGGSNDSDDGDSDDSGGSNDSDDGDSDDSGGSGSDDDSDDSGGSDDGGSDDSGDNSSDNDADDATSEPSPLEVERDAVAEATEGILQELEDTREVCRRFDADMAAASLAADYQRSNDAFSAASGVPSATHAATQSFIQTGEEVYTGVQYRLNERQHALRERFGRETAREVGDPIRISDGQFTFEVPLPVIRHWEISVDLTLRYDGARAERSDFGAGWWWEPAQRTIPGVRPLPAMEPVLHQLRQEIEESRAELSAAYRDTFGKTDTVGGAEGELTVLMEEWSAAMEVYSQLREALADLAVRAAGDPVMEPVVDEAVQEVEELIAVSTEEMSRFSGSLEFLTAWDSGRAALANSDTVLDEAETRYTQTRSRYDDERTTQTDCLPAGATAQEFEIGSRATAYFDGHGTLHTFAPEDSHHDPDDPITAPTLPWHDLFPGTSGGKHIREPSGTQRHFDERGHLIRIEDAAGHALIFSRDSQGRIKSIRDETGSSRATFTWSDSACVIDLPEMEPTTVRMDGATVQVISGPRGTLDFEYQHGLLTRVERADGSWTAIAREDGPERRVTAVRQSTGAVERMRYEPGHRHIYIDPDGYETRYHLAEHRVQSVRFPSGLHRWFEYDEHGRLISWSDNRGGGARHTYDERGARRAVEWADGTWKRVTRDSQGRIVREESDRGTIAGYRYADDGSIAEQTDATGESVFFASGQDETVDISSRRGALARVRTDDRGNPIEIARSDGRRVVRRYDDLGRELQIEVDGIPTVNREFDGAGRLISRTTAEGVVRYGYDASGNVAEIRRNGSLLEEREYDPVGHLLRRRFHDGTEERMERSPAGRLVALTHRDGSRWRVTYDRHGRPTVITESSGERHRTFAYAGDGRLVTMSSTEQGVVELVYNDHGRHIGYRYADGSQQRRMVRPGGRVEVNTPEGRTIDIEVDAAGRPRRVHTASGETVVYRHQAGQTTTSRDGTMIRTEDRDRFGRLQAVHFPDGTSESWSYADGGRTRIFTDRRGAIHTETRDRWHRPLSYTAGDGYQVQWTYEGDWVEETRSDGTFRRYRRDARGSVVEERSSRGTVHRIPGESGQYRIETNNREGSPISKLFFDQRDRLVEQWTREGGTIYAAAYPAPGIEEYRLLGYAERREVVIPEQEIAYSRGEDPAYQVEQTRGGAPRRISSESGEIAAVRWFAPGLPASVAVTAGDATVEHRYSYSGGHVDTYHVSGLDPRRYVVDEIRRRVSVETTGARREIIADPYGVITAETIELSDAPRIDIRRTLDNAGRVVDTETRIAGSEQATAQSIDVRPHRQGATVATAGSSVEIRDGDTETEMVIDGEFTITARVNAVELNDLLRVSYHHGAEGAAFFGSLARTSRSGFTDIIDAIAGVRNAYGQVIAEQRIDGHAQTFHYDRGGRLVASSGGAGGVITSVSPEVARKISESWRSTGVSVTPPDPPQTINRHDLHDSSPTSVQRDSAGRVTRLDGTSLTYDETSGRPQGITTADGESWTVIRDATGDPAVVINSKRGQRWTAATSRYESRLGPLVVRSWTVHEDITTPRIPRYRAGSGGTPSPSQSESCLEVSRNGRLLYVVDQDAIYLPFTDLRATTRGVVRVDRTTGAVQYTPWSSVLPEVEPQGLVPPDRGVRFPAAIPYDRIVYGMMHLPGTPALWGVERSYLPEMGAFTAMDPALHHVDWFDYAAGDPVNFLDIEGLRFIPIQAGHTHFQQQGWWNDEQLGNRGIATVGSSGCVLTGVSNMINTINGERTSNPGTLNWYARDGFFRDGNLLSTSDTAEILQAATGHHIETVSFDPRTVDMTQVAAAIEDDTVQQYAATARIRTYRTNPDGTIDEYEHTVNVAGFDERGEPIVHDTSSRNRTSLDHREEVLRYDVYAVSNCRGY